MKRFRFVSILLAALLLAAAPALAKDKDNQVDTGLLPDSSFIYETSIYALQTSDTYYEGQTVQITGEVVGDIAGRKTMRGANGLPSTRCLENRPPRFRCMCQTSRRRWWIRSVDLSIRGLR